MKTKPVRAYEDNHAWIIAQAEKKGWSVADEVEALVKLAQHVKYQYTYERVSEKMSSKKSDV